MFFNSFSCPSVPWTKYPEGGIVERISRPFISIISILASHRPVFPSMITKARSALITARSSEKYILGISPEWVNTPMLESAFSERVDSELSVIIGAPKSVILFGLGEISILSVVPSI